MALLATLYLLPLLGTGPIWNKFDTSVAGCNNYWWTNLIWINNIYPRNFEDKCLPWTWFVPCYIQLSLCIPPLVAFYKFIENKMIPALLFIILGGFALIAQFCLVYFTNKGGTIVMNDEFFAKVYMNPIFHFSSFLYGIVMSLVYYRFKKERGYASALRNSISSRMMELIRHNNSMRYIMYLIAISCIISSVLW